VIFSSGLAQLDNGIYINPPARYPCPGGNLLKLTNPFMVFCQAQVKSKQEVINWLKGSKNVAANDTKTIWI
jgi:hypothetical protein